MSCVTILGQEVPQLDSLGVLKKERAELAGRLKALDSAIIIIGGQTAGSKSKGKMSEATKAKIRAAAKARWAKVKKAGSK